MNNFLKKVLVYGILIFLTIFLGYRVVEKNFHAPTKEKAQLILFVSNQCPHCAEVKKYIDKNSLYNRLPISIKEISGNKDNLNELIDIANNRCKEHLPNVPIPFLWTGSVCYAGDITIINYFQQLLEKKTK